MRITVVIRLLAAAAIGLSASACGVSDDDSGGGDGGVGNGSGTVREIKVPATVVFGSVRSGSGATVAGAQVTGGESPVETDDSGRFEVRATPGTALVFKFEAEGFVPATRTLAVFEKRATAVHVQLVPESPPQPLDASEGGAVDGPRGARVMAPAMAFQLPDGSPAVGAVDVHLTPLDPSNAAELGANSGDFLGVELGGGAPTALESFGMLDVTVRQNGEKLQVAPGQALDIEIPAPADARGTPPATIALWSFDHTQDRWVREGEATLNATTGRYQARIEHMSSWNCDQPLDATCITGLVRDDDGAPMPGAQILAEGVDYFGRSSATTLDDGRFYVAVRKDSDVALLAEHELGGGQIREVHSGTEDTDVPPTPGDPRCLDVGEWTAVPGQVTLTDGRTIDCADVSNPLSGGCAAEMWEGAFTCFEPYSSCDIQTEAGSSESVTTYDNGNRMELSYDQAAGSAHVEFYKDGSLCLTEDASGITSVSTHVELVLPNGRRWLYDISDGESSDLVITCPDGQTVVLTPEDRAVLEACTSEDYEEEDGAGVMCTYNGQGPSVPENTGNQGNIDARCTTAADCTGGNTCCTVTTPQTTVSMCYPQQYCAQLQQAAANSWN